MQMAGVFQLALPPHCLVLKMTVVMVAVVAICFSRIAVVDAEVKLSPGTKLLNDNDSAHYGDCWDLRQAGYNVSGMHKLHMNKTTPFLIWCEFTKDNAFTVIQQRSDGSLSFVQPLQVYMDGFGNTNNYWAGLNSIHYLTEIQGNRILRVILHDWAGNVKSGQYKTFIVQSVDNKYRMVAGTYSTLTGLPDDLSYSSGSPFHTYDYPDINHCATNMKAGWWYNYCAYTLLNGHYYVGGPYTPSGGFYDGIFWKDWGGFGYSFKFVQMQVSRFG